ncbi:uncharacterized protein KNAG_0F02070 [Huiozyma naganishii CBS 8797]|uniref:Uncharacterized protein n=1 Tax=Huiozyma naganishii (strain ATCC MYA-139 / BCRC 22969 / CBS 8797 / KCTC 17520 / NBRC 10181 / NCYC 3082 / Yp74L-3) TaxID=1071383 RepID=J7S7B1_HUIN7|nr:hypothetical protein KNAG_0F02070 [Kazachstania naganishii CBS 8797]CCK70874.1 hypothetical protein KNAG_0F02070 [Kazachstania naganishii CBS 8797]
MTFQQRIIPFYLGEGAEDLLLRCEIQRAGHKKSSSRRQRQDNLCFKGKSLSAHHAVLEVEQPRIWDLSESIAEQFLVRLTTQGEYPSVNLGLNNIRQLSRNFMIRQNDIIGLVAREVICNGYTEIESRYKFQVRFERDTELAEKWYLIFMDVTGKLQYETARNYLEAARFVNYSNKLADCERVFKYSMPKAIEDHEFDAAAVRDDQEQQSSEESRCVSIGSSCEERETQISLSKYFDPQLYCDYEQLTSEPCQSMVYLDVNAINLSVDEVNTDSLEPLEEQLLSKSKHPGKSKHEDSLSASLYRAVLYSLCLSLGAIFTLLFLASQDDSVEYDMY